MTDDLSPTASGSCLCGAVRYRTNAPLGPGFNACHCTQCRKQSGHHAAYVAAGRAADVTIDGAGNVTWYRASDTAKRGFCRICGSQLFWVPDDGGTFDVSGGTLDEHPPIALTGHIFVADKGAYYDIADGLPTYPQDS
ncbi:MAG: GFA family protein [Rhodospirillales bacterium]